MYRIGFMSTIHRFNIIAIHQSSVTRFKLAIIEINHVFFWVARQNIPRVSACVIPARTSLYNGDILA